MQQKVLRKHERGMDMDFSHRQCGGGENPV